MISVDVLRPSQLDASARAAWDALASAPQFASPFFARGFCEALESVGVRVRVALARQRAEWAFLPFQGGALGFARPAGGPLNDLHGLIAAPGSGFALDEVLTKAGVRAMGLSAAPLAQARALDAQAAARPFAVMGLADGFEAWREGRAAQRKKAFANLRSRANKLARRGQEAKFVHRDDRPETLDAIIALKRAQMQRTGVPDLFARPWTSRLLQAFVNGRWAGVEGIVSALEIDGELAAAHMGLSTPRAAHHWFPVYAHAHRDVSPGHMLLLRLAEAFAGEGVQALHLGDASQGYKDDFADQTLPVAAVVAHARGPLSAGWSSLSAGARRLAHGASGPATWPARAIAKLDRAAAYRGA